MEIQALDTQLLLLINQGSANALFDVLMPALSAQGYLLVVPFLFFIMLEGRRRKNAAGKRHLIHAIAAVAIACSAVYLAGHVEDWTKNAVARVRPCRALDGLRLIVTCPKSYSMPSGHATSSFAFAAPLVYLAREYVSKAWRAYPLVLASLIAFSRPYLGVHYPTDILAGALLGTMIGLILAILYEVLAGYLQQRKKRTTS
jgi:undecaprenyl-diphosphatase